MNTANCPVCSSLNTEYAFTANKNEIMACKDCGHFFIGRQDVHTEPIHEIDIPSENFLTGVYQLNTLLDFSFDPYSFLVHISKSMKPDGTLVLMFASRDSKNAKKMSYKWPVFAETRQQFFNNETMQNLLCRCGFRQITLQNESDDMVSVSCKLGGGGLREKPLLSFIIPIYNEANTVRSLLDAVYNKKLDGVDKEYIIIESNSKDGTREIVQDFVKEHPEAKLVLEERPQGKGHAVRAGFEVATGDFITIQDGDLEYDINDYDELIKPLQRYQKAFVLGSRHAGNWKIRDYGNEKKGLAAYINFGHILLTGLVNFGCKTKLKDPFTMYKLFRRECLFNLDFDGNRFEIDWEIVIKLIRKGFIPQEIPVNYKSRGFSEGKKIALLKDPLICVWSFFRYNYLYRIDK